MPHEHEVHEYHDDQEDVDRQVALAGLVVRESLPTETVAGGQRLGRDLLNRLDRLAAGITRRRGALNRRGRIEVVPVDLIEPLELTELGERGIRHHFPFVVLHKKVLEVLRVAAELRHGLDEDLVELPKRNESLLPRAADDDREVVHRLSDRDAFLHGDVVVDHHLVLWIVTCEKREQPLDLGPLRQRCHKFLGHLAQPQIVRRVCLVEHADREPACGSKAGYGRRLKKFQLDIRDCLPVSLKLLDDLLGRQLPLGPRLEVDQTRASVRTAALGQHLVAGKRGYRLDAVDLLGDFLEFAGLGIGVLDRRTGGCLDDAVDHPLVFERDESGGEPQVHHIDARHEHADDSECEQTALDDRPQQCRVSRGHLFDPPIEEFQKPAERPEEKPQGAPRLRGGVRLEDHRAQHRRKRQGHHARKHDSRRHRDSELPIECPYWTGHERHRDEYRRHHQRDCDDSTADLADHFLRRKVG